MRVSLKGAENHWDLPMWYGWPSRASGYDPTLAEVPRSWYAANHPCRSMFVSHHSLTLFLTHILKPELCVLILIRRGGDKKDGGCSLGNASDLSAVPLRCWSNAITFNGSESIDFHLDLLITPFRDLNSVAREHFGIRHYQLGYPISNDATPPAIINENFGSTVIGLHQGTSVNPFISWIFDPDTSKNMSRYIASAHAQDMRVKTYFTVRELSVRSALCELFGIVSLGDEILDRRLEFPDPWEHRDNLGNPWLQEHMLNTKNATEPGYSIAYNLLMPWNKQGFAWDFALHVKGDSRWVNWYVEALHWAATKGMTSPPDNITIGKAPPPICRPTTSQ